MKKQFLLFTAAFLLGVSSLMAQARTAPVKLTPEERTKSTMEKLASFDLKPAVKTDVEAVLTNFYTAQQTAMKEMQEMRATGGGDGASMMEKRKKLADDRDAKLKQLFTEEQYAKWVSEVEPTTRPQRSQRPAPAPAQAN